MTQFLECAINVCVDSQPCMSNKKEENCPKMGVDGLFGFTLNGVPNNFALPQIDEYEGSA